MKQILAHLGEPMAPLKLTTAHGPPLLEAAQPDSVDLFAQAMPEFEFNQRIAW